MNASKWLEGIALIFLVLMVTSTWRWQRLVKIALFVVVFEGAIRKWLLPGLSQFVYFGKDFLVLLAAAKFLSAREGSSRILALDRLLSTLTLLASGYIALESANICLGSPLIGIMGARNYLVYLPLLHMGRYLFHSEEELAKYLRWYVPICIPVVVLAMLQYLSPPSSPLNVYVASEEASQALIGGDKVRATGTFSYIAGFGVYLQTMIAFVVPLLVMRHSKKWDLLFRVTLGSIAAGIVLSGSRGVLIYCGSFVILYFVCNRTFRKLGLYKRFVPPALVLIVLGAAYFSASIITFASRFSQNTDLPMRVLIIFTTPLAYSIDAGLFGFGAGATYQANGRMRELFGLGPGVKIPVYYEGEPERVMLELALGGFVLWYALRIRILVLLWRTFKSAKRPLLKELALTAFITHVLALPSQVVFQVTFNLYYWFMASFIFLIPRLEQVEAEREALEEQAKAERKARSHTTNLSSKWNPTRY